MLFFAFTGIFGMLLNYLYKFHNEKMYENIPIGSIYDLKWAVLSATIIGIIRLIANYFFVPLMRPLVDQKRWPS